jgi:ELWxxDGT repeat protein
MARIFFLRSDAQGHPDLWVTNGTVAGTQKVQDFVNARPSGFTKVNSTLFFAADDGMHGTELWRSDGTTATTIVKDIATGNDPNGNPAASNPADLTNINGTLFFTASGEVWRSDDGTDLTTKIVKDIHPGASSSFPKYLTNVGGELYFVASDSTGNGQYLWMSNGNEAGTNPVPGAANSSGSLNSESLISFNGALFFSGTDGSGAGAHGQELWKSDGTGVQLVKDIWPGTGNGSGSSFPQAIFVGTRGGTPILYFVANDGSHGNELWESDGSASGTVMVKDINSGSGNGLSLNGNVVPFASMNGILYFFASNGTDGFELWRSDGVPDPNNTGTGTRMVKDIHSGTASSVGGDFHDLTVVGNTLYFTAFSTGHGTELWKSDGTEAGTIMVKEIAPGQIGSNPSHLINVGGTLFFSAFDGNSTGLWRSDGTAATTVKVAADGFVDGSQIVATDESGLVHLTVARDFNIDGTSDVFWRNNATGHVGVWSMNNGVPTWQDLGGSGVDHKVAGIGDFNGDGTADLFWRNDSSGHVGTWEMHDNVSTWHDLGGSGVDHKVVGIGDFNADGTADVLWRNDSSGHVGTWEMHDNVQTWHDLGGSGIDHKVAGIGDFNADGTADVLWRNDSSGHVGIWEMHDNVPTWHDLGGSGIDHKVVGIGDFNGDGTADVLWRNDSSGHVGIWEMHDNVQTWHDLGGSGTDHKVAGIGDYNGDGTSDIFWRNDATGHVGIWEMHNNVQTWHDLGGSGVDHSFIV